LPDAHAAPPELSLVAKVGAGQYYFTPQRENEMGTDREEWISKRAYELWEQAGRPEGQDEEQWHAASAEWESEFGPVDAPVPDGAAEENLSPQT